MNGWKESSREKMGRWMSRYMESAWWRPREADGWMKREGWLEKERERMDWEREKDGWIERGMN